MKKDRELEYRVILLTLQKERLIKRWQAKKRRDAFVRRNMKKILRLAPKVADDTVPAYILESAALK